MNFAKSLDRPVEIFGIKGKWLTVFLVMAGASILFALILGSMFTSGVGISAAIILVVASFMGSLLLQGKVSSRQLSKYRASSKIVPYVSRRETLCRILLPEKAYEQQRKEAGK